jgi:HrpA-like RNA helicase
MGGGTREGDDDAQLTFVTTGYLVRFVAYHPEAFDNYTHLIIDEVHERSVDSDLLCYLSRKLLTTNSKLKLILMSATVHTTLYKDYFSGEGYNYGDLQCLSVGRRRFENAISYVDDLVNGTCSGEVVLPSILLTQAKKILSYDPKKKDPRDPNSARELDVVILAQYVLAKELIRWNAKRGTAVLVFVAGMKDIDEFLEKFEEDEDYKVIAIHSDIPFEEQEQALVAAKPNEIKVIVATNAAESSLTLPDVDIVICLGTQKSIEYDASTHSVQLIKKWISKSSAIQRAGRTGNIIVNIITTIIVIITTTTKAVFDLVQSFVFTPRLYTKVWKIMSSLK